MGLFSQIDLFLTSLILSLLSKFMSGELDAIFDAAQKARNTTYRQ